MAPSIAVPTATDNMATELPPATTRFGDIGDLTNKIALITGGSSGVGRCIAEAYAAAGAFVISADLTPNPPVAPLYQATMKTTGIDITTPTVELLNRNYPSTSTKPRATFVQCNVTSSSSMQAAIAVAVHTYGRLDILVNNAGISAVIRSEAFRIGGKCRVHEMDDETLDKDFAVNVRGVWLGIKHACVQFLAQEPHASGDRGWIINITSVMGLVALPGTASYCTTKGAALALTKAAALDYAADGIHINCIAPGWIDTAMLEPMMANAGEEEARAKMAYIKGLHPVGRLARPEEISSAAVFLAGRGVSFVTGTTLVVDGGYTTQ